MFRRAFTLIELLVVIAIIAILAAILFPVFAQAKVAAKGAASLSNIKQHITAWTMYANDYDDTAVPYATRTPGPLLLNNHNYSTWSWLQQPYTKSPDLTQDPLTTPNRPTAAEAGIPTKYLWPYRPQYGYAFTIWSPLTQGAVSVDGAPSPKKLTEATHPSETVVFTGRKTRETLDWIWTGTAYWMQAAVAPPFCGGGNGTSAQTNTNPQGYCVLGVRWGVQGHNVSGTLTPYPTDVDGGRTGSVALRKTMLSLVAFSDGHAKFMPPARLASGTNWHWNVQPAQIQMIDKGKYLWDLD
jgi:prepilin-type N-terminal cleavage/methylation domain-containing protein